MKKIFKRVISKTIASIGTSAFVFLLVLPASTNYKLKDFGFGNGGVGNASSAAYSMEAITGELSSGGLSSVSYKLGNGLMFGGQANLPQAPSFTNPSNFYNKLQIILNTANNPSDTKFAIAISTDNFSTITKFIQNDNTVGLVLGAEDYQAYTSWGGASGFYVIGLAANTNYQIKVKSIQGKFTETGYSQIANATTSSAVISFGINLNTINFGNLNAGTVMDSPQNIVTNFTTNAENGGKIYIIGKNNGLLSLSKSYTISSVTGNLNALTQGFGVQGVSASQSSGGPLSIASPYNVSANNVGLIDPVAREIFSSSFPISGGVGTFLLKAKSSNITPAASDYSESLTVIAASNF